jgi:hypothetical protein
MNQAMNILKKTEQKKPVCSTQVVLTLQFVAEGLPFSDSVRLQVPWWIMGELRRVRMLSVLHRCY